MKKMIIAGIAAISLTGTAMASEGGDSFPLDKTELFNVQRGIVTQPSQAARYNGMSGRAYHMRTVDGAFAYAPSHADRESSQQ